MLKYDLRKGDYRQVLADMPPVDLVFTSPPYNVGSGGPRKDGQRKDGKYDAKSYAGVQSYPDCMPEGEYQRSQHDFLEWAGRKLKPNGVIVYNHKIRYRNLEAIHPITWFPSSLVLYTEVVWDRGSTQNQELSYPAQHTERIWVLRKVGGKPIKRAKGSPHVSDVWRIPRGPRTSKVHDAVMPLELALRAVNLWCPPGGIICDPYSGSGTTMLAAVMSGREFYGSDREGAFIAESRDRLDRYLKGSLESSRDSTEALH